MARYCFYCGRELATGEKCSCRVQPSSGATKGSAAAGSASAGDRSTRSNAGSAGSAGTSGSTSSAGSAGSAGTTGRSSSASASSSSQSGPKAKGPQGPSFWSRFQAQQAKSRQPKRPAGKGSGSGRPVDWAVILAGLQQIGKYLARPVETIRQSVQYANTNRLMAFLMIHAVLGGFAVLAVGRQGTLDLMMQLTVVGSADNSLLETIFLFFQGVGLTLTLDLLLILITHLALRYVFRAGFSFNRIATSFVPVIFYQALFLLLAIFSLTTIPISSLMTLAAGLAVAAVALYLALRQLTNFEENRCFMLLTFILIIFTSVLAMVLSLALPVFKVLLDQTLPL